jgi:uncharacterized protein
MASMILQPFIAKLVEWRVALLICGLTLGVLAYFPSQNLQFDRAIENMFAPDDPLLPPYQQLKRTFGGNEIILAAYVDPTIMTDAGMNRLGSLSDQLKQVPGVAAVLAVNGGPLGNAVIDDRNPLARAFLELFEGYTIGKDRKTVGVACLLDPKSTVPRQEIVNAARQIVETHDASGMVVGEPVMVVDGFRYLEQDGFLLGVVSTSLLVITIVLCFRSLRWVIVPLAVVQLTLLMTQAILVLGRLHLSMVSSMLTAIVTIVGIGTTVHLIVRFRELRAEGLSPQESLKRAAIVLAPPIFWSIATDMVGFGALLIAKVGPIHDFGLMMAIGSGLVLFCLVLLVPGLSLIGELDADPKRAWGEHHLQTGLAGLSRWIEHHPRPLWIASLLISLVAILGISHLQVETDFTKNFRASSPVVKSYAFVEEHLGGAGVWDVIIPAPESLDWTFLEKLSRCEERLRSEVTIQDATGASQPGLTKVLSVADVVNAGSLGAIGKLPAFARGPMVTTALSQMQSQMPEFTQALVGKDPAEDGKPYVRIMLRSQERQRAEQKQRLIGDVTRIVQEEFPEAKVTGFFVLLTNLVESTTRDQWTTFALATVGIFIMVLLAFRSLKLAFIALVPNALPIFIVTGLMGWLGLKINMGAAMIASVSMGLSVDSSMHYITDYLNQRRAGKTVHQAIAVAHQNVGTAMVFSTLALVIGFSALCLSQFVPTIYFGALVGLTMLGGLAGNLIVLPLLLAVTERSSRAKPDVAAAS